MKKILLFGASGQLGKEWQNFLALHNDSYLVIPYTSSQLDITRFTDVKHEIIEQNPDYIINCAAYTKVDDAEEETEKAFKVNSKAVKNIAELCDHFNIKLIHFSTDYIFAGKKEDGDQFPEGYPEDHAADPINVYGQSKWEGEQAIRQSGCRHVIMRVSWLCGAEGHNFVKTMLRLADKHEELSIVDDQLGSPTFTYPLVKNTLQLLKNEQNGTYHYTSKGLLSWADFAAQIFEITGKDVKINRVPSSEYPTKAERPFFSKLDTAKIASMEGIEIGDWKKELQQLLNQINELNLD